MPVELFAAPSGKGDQARRKLLLAGLRFFGEKGYEDASVREIAGAAEKNVASIAYYFGGKEQFYHAVIEGVVVYLGAVFSGPVAEAAEFLEGGQRDPVKAAGIMKKMLRSFLMEHIEREDINLIRALMIREQTDPSPSFELLYEQILQPMHNLSAAVLGVATGEDPESPALIVRSHAIFGQVMGFTVARYTVLRRLGLTKMTPEAAELIATIVDEHVDLISAGLLGRKNKR